MGITVNYTHTFDGENFEAVAEGTSTNAVYDAAEDRITITDEPIAAISVLTRA